MISLVTVAVPPAEEPVSLELARLHLRVDQAGDDMLIAGYITAARTWAEQYLGRALIAQQLSWTIAQDLPQNAYPVTSLPLQLLVLPLWFPWPLHHRQALRLPWLPVISVDEVSYGQWGQPDTVLVAGTDYDIDIASARVKIHVGSEVIPNDHLTVLFTAGYGSDPSSVPQPVISAILMLTAFLYEARGDEGGEMPKAAEMLLTPYRLVRFG